MAEELHKKLQQEIENFQALQKRKTIFFRTSFLMITILIYLDHVHFIMRIPVFNTLNKLERSFLRCFSLCR